MAKQQKPVLRQRIFEARYEQGYRYLDRCGELLVLLEKQLTDLSGCVWLPGELAPTGATLKCPDLDITMVFDAFRFILDQSPVGEIECEFDELAVEVLATITGRLDLRQTQRLGARRVKILPADSIEDAEKLSLRVCPVREWCCSGQHELQPRAYEQASVFELPDRSKGVRILTIPYHKIGTELQLDERLKVPPHHLPSGQHTALVEQQRRLKQQQKDPEAGVRIDIDYYWIRPPKEWSVRQFLNDASQEAARLEEMLLNRSGER